MFPGQARGPAQICSLEVGALEFGEINELVKSARTRYSERVLQATGQEISEQAARETALLPPSIEIWRGWGTAVTLLNTHGEKGT